MSKVYVKQSFDKSADYNGDPLPTVHERNTFERNSSVTTITFQSFGLNHLDALNEARNIVSHGSIQRTATVRVRTTCIRQTQEVV